MEVCHEKKLTANAIANTILGSLSAVTAISYPKQGNWHGYSYFISEQKIALLNIIAIISYVDTCRNQLLIPYFENSLRCCICAKPAFKSLLFLSSKIL